MSVSRLRSGRYQGTVLVDGLSISVGTYETRELAEAAVDAERARVGEGTSALLRRTADVMDATTYAARICVPKGTVARWVMEGLPTLAVGTSAIRIDAGAADAWVAEHHPKSVSFARESMIYFIRRQPDEAIKIGWTSDVFRRMYELKKKGQKEIVLLAAIPGDKLIEGTLHARFADERIDPNEEWFRTSERLCEFIAGLGRAAA